MLFATRWLRMFLVESGQMILLTFEVDVIDHIHMEFCTDRVLLEIRHQFSCSDFVQQIKCMLIW